MTTRELATELWDLYLRTLELGHVKTPAEAALVKLWVQVEELATIEEEADACAAELRC